MRDCIAPVMQKAPHAAELSLQSRTVAQRPKNSHNRMITGIGTPSIQSNIPLAIASSSSGFVKGERRARDLVPGPRAYQWPVFGIDAHGSCGGFGSPFCNSSIECRSGERTKAMLPSRGGRLMVTPAFCSFSQVA